MEDMDLDQQTNGGDGFDDLFFESASDDTPIVAEVGSALTRRLEELELSGCCQNVAWSKLGAIAFINNDKTAVKVTPYPLDSPPRFKVLETQVMMADSEIINITWDSSGHYLAVVDDHGRICIFRMFGALDKLSLVGRHIPTKPDICNGVVGLHWIGSSYRPEPKVCATVRNVDGKWRYDNIKENLLTGPQHPMNEREALFFITRDGVLHFMVAQDQMDHDRNLFVQVQSILSPAASVQSLLSHASFAPEQDQNLLIVTCDLSSTLRLYRVGIDWHYNVPPGKGIPPGFRLTPSINVKRLDVCAGRPSLDGNKGNEIVSRIMHVNVLPSIGPPSVEQRVPAEVVAIFKQANATSQVVRWKLQEIKDELHPVFRSITNTSASRAEKSSSTSSVLHLDDDFHVHHTFLSVHSALPMTAISLLRSDGILEIRSREDLKNVESVAQDQKFSCLVNAGFEFSSDDNSINATISPNGCTMMVRTTDMETGEEVLLERFMELQNEPSRTSGSAALAMVFASACFQDRPMDDILAVVKHWYRKDSFNIDELLMEFFVASIAIDPVNHKDPARLTTHQSFHRSLSAAYDLHRLVEKDLQSTRTARLLLYIRHIGYTLFLACDSSKRADVTQSEIPSQVLPLVSWYTKIATYIVGEMMAGNKDIVSPQSEGTDEKTTENPTLLASSPALRVLLSFCGRRTLRLVHKYLDFLVRHIRNEAIKDGTPPHAVRQGWQDLAHEILHCPVGINHLDKYLASIDAAIMSTAEQNGADEEKMLGVERSIIVNGSVPDIFKGVIDNMYGSLLDSMIDNLTDASEVFFAPDFWLWHSSDPTSTGAATTLVERKDDESESSKEEKSRYALDIIKKTPLIAAAAMKKCMRCGSCAEAPFKGSQMPRWIIEAGKYCICGGSWISLDP